MKRTCIVAAVGLGIIVIVGAYHFWSNHMYRKGYDCGYSRGSDNMFVLRSAFYIGLMENIATHPLLELSDEQKRWMLKWQEDEIREIRAKKTDIIDSSPSRDLIERHLAKKITVEPPPNKPSEAIP